MSFVGTLPGLVFGSIDLLDSVGPFKLYAITGDTTFGNPDPVITTVASLLGDGSLVSIDRVDNREIVIGVEINAADSQALALAEQALMLETRRQNTLTWTPADEFAGTTTVFEVLSSWMEHDFDDLDDARLVRRYKLHLICYPYARSENEVEYATADQPGTPTTTTIDTCDSTTGWTGNATVQDGGDYLFTVYDRSRVGAAYWYTANVRRTGASIDLTSTPYVVVDIRQHLPGGSYWHEPTLTTAGGTFEPIASAPAPITGTWTRYWFDATAAVMATTYFQVNSVIEAGATNSGELRITNLIRTNVPPGGATARQKFLTIPIAGSAPADGSLIVEHETSSLGSVILYTCPQLNDGYQPPLRGYLTGFSTTTTDATLVSGAYTTIDLGVTYDVPTQTLEPGTYALVARLRADATGDIDIDTSTRTRVNSVNLDAAQVDTTTVTFDTADEWGIFPLAVLHLPTRLVSPSAADAYMRMVIALTSPGGTSVDLDEAWLFRIDDDSKLTIVHRTGTPAAPSSGGWYSRIWVDQATVSDPQPHLWAGYADDRSDAYHPSLSIVTWDQHRFVPASMNVYLVTSNAEDATVSVRYFPRWHTFAAE
jgi:hypothetical protein